jgi:hypothetical protein
VADNDEQQGQKGKNTRIPPRRKRADEQAARPANLTPAEARRREVAQTAVSIHGDLVPRPPDAQTSADIEIATRAHDEPTTIARGEQPEPVPEPSPIQISNVRCTVWLNGVRITGRCSGTFTPGSP